MRPHPFRAVAAAIALLLPAAAGAGPLELIEADPTGITVRVEVPAYRVLTVDPDGRVAIDVVGFGSVSAPGRPVLPVVRTLVAIPPGARARARVLAASPEELRNDLRLTIAGEPSIQPDVEGLGFAPVIDAVAPILDGVWPAERVNLGAPFSYRHQRVVPLVIHPFRYDESDTRLSVARTLTVRIDFLGARADGRIPAEEDRHFEAVFEGAFINYQQGRTMRLPRQASPRPALETPSPSSLLERPLPGTLGGGARGVTRTPAAFDETEPEVRIRVDSTGVYAFSYDALAARGFPINVPVNEVSLHRHVYDSAPVAPAPPYTTREIPIEVRDANANGVFDSGDAILSYVQTWAERVGASVGLKNWGEAEVVYATRLPGRSGLRFPTRSGWRSQTGLTPMASYPHTRRWEKNFQYMTAYAVPRDTGTVDPFHWTNIALYYDRPDTIAFDINDLDTTQTATVTLHWIGRSASTRFLFARITARAGLPGARVTQVADSSNTFWSGRQPFSRSEIVPGGALSEGANNRLGFWGKPSSAAPASGTNEIAFVGLNALEVTHARRFRALRGYLPCNSGTAAGEIEIVARGFTDTTRIRVWDVTDPEAPMRIVGAPIEPDGGAWQVRMQDSVAAGSPRRYVLADQPKTLPASSYGQVTRRSLHTASAGDYLIVVPEAMLPAVTPLVNLRTSQGLSVVVAPLESLNDEFGEGRHSAYSVRNFLRFGFRSWNTRFALLVGDATEDPLNHGRTARPDWVPTQMIGGPVPFSTGFESAFERIPSDGWYGWCMSCELFDDYQNTPKVHELFVGRLPVNSLSEATAVIAKIVGYENFAPDQLWRRKMLLLADDMYSGVTTFGGGPVSSSYCKRFYEDRFRLLSEKIRDVILLEAGLVESDPEVFDLGYWLRNEPCNPCAPDSCRPDRFATQLRTRTTVTPEVLQRLNDGRLWWNYQGHANEYEMAHEDVYRNLGSDDDKTKLMNQNKLFLFSAFSCHPNAFGRAHEADQLGASFGEELVTLPNTGAVASWASSGYEIIPHNGFDHINVELARALFSSPPRDRYLGQDGARPVIGEAVALALLRWLPTALAYPFERDVGVSYSLLGDPATSIWVGPSQAALTANAIPVTTTDPIRLRTPGNTLRLEARLASNAALRTIEVVRTDSTGIDTIPPARYVITPAFPDTGAASAGGRSYTVTLDTTLTPRAVTYSVRTRDRYGVPGRHDAVFDLTTVLRADGQTVNDGDPVAPSAGLSLQVLSPSPLTPQTDLQLTLNGTPITFSEAPSGGDTSGREWLLTWTGPPLPIDQYVLQLAANNGDTKTHLFRVDVGGGELRIDNLMAFPNPFQDDIGTRFSFTLVSGSAADLLIRVYTVTGKLVYERRERGLPPGYHQLAWDGRDAEGMLLANGIYFYRMAVSNGASKQTHEGRLVKLRRPRRQIIDETASTP